MTYGPPTANEHLRESIQGSREWQERHAIHEASPHYIPSPDTGPSRLSKRVAVLVVAMVVGGIALVAWRFL
jgi:hypothetical protein